MARPLDTAHLRKPPRSGRNIVSSTGRGVGAALACLLVTSLVVDRSLGAIHPAEAGTGTAFTAASIGLSDDDEGRSLVNLSNLIPGVAHQSCITVTYEGTIFPVDLELKLEASGELLRFVDVTMEQGDDGSFGDCDGFAPQRVAFSGTLADLAEDPVAITRLVSELESRTFRFTFEVQDTVEAMGKTATADLVWVVDP